VADSAPGGASDFNSKMIEEFRANEGRVGGPWAGTALAEGVAAIALVAVMTAVARAARCGTATRLHPPGGGSRGWNSTGRPRVLTPVGALVSPGL
jgi:hypothetical protein